MNLIATVSDLVDEPQDFIDRAGNKEIGWAGICGCLFGTLSIFTFLRMFSAVPPGVYSFLNVLAIMFGINFFFASAMHLFLEMTGSRGAALKLFFLVGATDFFWAVLIPLGFLAKVEYLNPVTDFLLCAVIVLLARISLIRRLYSISRNKALLALSLPYAALAAGFFMVVVYAIVYMVWLLI